MQVKHFLNKKTYTKEENDVKKASKVFLIINGVCGIILSLIISVYAIITIFSIISIADNPNPTPNNGMDIRPFLLTALMLSIPVLVIALGFILLSTIISFKAIKKQTPGLYKACIVFGSIIIAYSIFCLVSWIPSSSIPEFNIERFVVSVIYFLFSPLGFIGGIFGLKALRQEYEQYCIETHSANL